MCSAAPLKSCEVPVWSQSDVVRFLGTGGSESSSERLRLNAIPAERRSCRMHAGQMPRGGHSTRAGQELCRTQLFSEREARMSQIVVVMQSSTHASTMPLRDCRSFHSSNAVLPPRASALVLLNPPKTKRREGTHELVSNTSVTLCQNRASSASPSCSPTSGPYASRAE